MSEDGSTIVGQLPAEYRNNGHYGPLLLGDILDQHYQCRTPRPLIVEQLQELRIEISTGQLNNILIEHKAIFHTEQQQVLRVGLETAEYVHTDDTGARHQGKNGYCPVIGNQWFAYFKSSRSKSRQTFLETIQGGALRYVLNDDAQAYLKAQPLAAKYRERLTFSDAILAENPLAWEAYLLEKGIVSAKAIQSISEAALLGGAMSGGINPRIANYQRWSRTVQCADSWVVLGTCRTVFASAPGKYRAAAPEYRPNARPVMAALSAVTGVSTMSIECKKNQTFAGI